MSTESVATYDDVRVTAEAIKQYGSPTYTGGASNQDYDVEDD